MGNALFIKHGYKDVVRKQLKSFRGRGIGENNQKARFYHLASNGKWLYINKLFFVSQIIY